MMVLLLGNAGLFMVDHIHFQYNGFLSGVLLLSVAALARHNYILAGILFSGLLMLKHIYLYIAPAYIVFMFRSYCFRSPGGNISWSSFSLVKLLMLGVSVLLNVALALGPFILTGDTETVGATRNDNTNTCLSRQPGPCPLPAVSIQARTVSRLLGA